MVGGGGRGVSRTSIASDHAANERLSLTIGELNEK